MTVEAQRFSFTEIDKSLGAASSLPYLPFTLSYQDTSLSVSGLLDTGATVNVLPYDIGRQLGAVWDQQTTPVHLTGNLARFEARVLIASADVGEFAPVRLALPGHEQCSTDSGTGELLFGVRCVFLPISEGI